MKATKKTVWMLGLASAAIALASFGREASAGQRYKSGRHATASTRVLRPAMRARARLYHQRLNRYAGSRGIRSLPRQCGYNRSRRYHRRSFYLRQATRGSSISYSRGSITIYIRIQ